MCRPNCWSFPRGAIWSRRSHIRIDAKRQALDALDAARRSTAHNGDGNGDGGDQAEIPAIVEVSDDLNVTVTSQFGFARIAPCR